MKTIDLQVEGMSCGSCVKHVTRPDAAGCQRGGRSPVWACRVSGNWRRQRPIVDGIDGCGLPAKLATDVHSRCDLAAGLGLPQRRRGAVVADDDHGI